MNVLITKSEYNVVLYITYKVILSWKICDWNVLKLSVYECYYILLCIFYYNFLMYKIYNSWMSSVYLQM